MKISQDKIDEMIKRIKNFKNYYIKKFSKLKYNELKTFQTTTNNNINNGIIENINNNQNLIEKSSNDISNNKPLNKQISNNSLDFGFEGKKTIPLKLTFKIIFQYIYVFTIIFCILILLFIYSRRFIKNDFNLIKSENFLMKNIFLFVLNMYELKLDLTYCTKITDINPSNITNSTDSVVFFETLEKFEKLSDFYYNRYSTDCCSAIYDKDTEMYEICFNYFLSEYINNTDAFLDFGNKLVAYLYYEFYENNSTENYGFSLLNSLNYLNLEITFENYSIHVIDKLVEFGRSAYHENAKKSFMLIVELNIILIVFFFAYFIYVWCIFLKILESNLYTSRSFILIIPSIYISNTQDLEVWLEKIDNIKK
jgi:hypothetical protein